MKTQPKRSGRQPTGLSASATILLISTYPHSLMFDIAYSGTFLIQSCSR